MEFSSKGYNSGNYSSARPSYPSEFFDTLRKYHVGGEKLLVDVGCGPGNFTLDIARNFQFERVEGADKSPIMIEVAQQKFNAAKMKNLHFSVHAAEDLDWVQAGTADMITAAQCSHWLDFKAFQESAFRALSENGTLAIWGYVDPILTDFPGLDSLLLEFQYDLHQLGPYWEKPGRDILRDLLQSQIIDDTKFQDVLEVCNRVRDPEPKASDHKPLIINREMSIIEFEQYIESWSAYNAWKRANQGKSDIRKSFIHQLKTQTGLSSQSRINVAWNTVYKFARKRT
ncbi:LANO_0C05864g1_1 [Lachancea nothofagi CBS 11611]|uniref:LANO_0C05864g1_1 n=1 Tax=Lachancea nothofagi CBS 11611 TaxID=1266666 RepID=A0A1G4J7M9_9SACH|nr:LANO_0C05864g1_1 [Lachancea nothofagi CBS 11611]